MKCFAISSDEIDERSRAVAHKLLQKEEELKFITAPGRIPPRAAVVAAMRKEIAALRMELAHPGNHTNMDLTSPAPRRVESNPAPVVQSKVNPMTGRRKKTPSSARNALLMVEKKLQGESSSADIPLSHKAMHALEMIERNMSTVSAVSKDLNELETLQVENAILRTKLEIILEKKRRLTQLCQALRKGYLSSEVKRSVETSRAARSVLDDATQTKSTTPVYTV